MHTAHTVTNERVFEAIRHLTHRYDGAMPVSDLCFFLGARRASIERAVRELEREGRLRCIVGAESRLSGVLPVGESRSPEVRPESAGRQEAQPTLEPALD